MNRRAGHTMNAVELTDPDGDALTITSDSAGVWITCSSGAEEVTVGPFPAGGFSAALAEVRLTSGEVQRAVA